MKMRIYLDRCIGAGNCVGVAPKVFMLNAQRKAELVDPRGADAAAIRDAAESCPTDAIVLIEDDGTPIHPPSPGDGPDQ